MSAPSSRYTLHAVNRVEVRPGDRVRVELPYSEAMMAARKAGQVWTVRVGNTSAQLIDPCGMEWGAPYLPCECGIYGSLRDGYYTYGENLTEQARLGPATVDGQGTDMPATLSNPCRNLIRLRNLDIWQPR